MLRSSGERYSGSAEGEATGLVGRRVLRRGALLGRAAIRLSGQEGSQQKPVVLGEAKSLGRATESVFRATKECLRGSPSPFLFRSQKEGEFLL